MFELSSEVPFLWRLSAERSDGYCSVSMIVPCPPDTKVRDLTIETDVQSLSSDSTRSVSEETLEWNQEDIDLFLRLINRRQLEVNQPFAETVRVDLTDPEVVEIINVVAAAGFGLRSLVWIAAACQRFFAGLSVRCGFAGLDQYGGRI